MYTLSNTDVLFSAPSKAPDHFTAPILNVTTNSAMLHWKPIPVQDQQGFLTHYEVCYTRRGPKNESHIETGKVLLLTK